MTKKFKDIVKRNPEPAKGKFGINPMDPWSIKSGIAEATDKKEEVMKCKNVKLHETKSCGCYSEEALAEAQSKRMSGADKFRKFMANRDKQHAEFMKGIEGKSHAEKMQAMMDKIKSNLNTEEVDLEEAKQHPYKFRATYHDPDTNEVTHYMDFTHRNLEAAKKHAQGSRLQRKDGKEDKLHSVVQMKEEVVNEMDKSQKSPAGWNLDDYDYNKGKWTRAKIMTSKDAVKDMGKELNKAFDKSPEQKKVKEEVEPIDELKKTTVFSWLKQQPVVPEKKPGMSRKDHNKKIKTSSKSWNRALDRLSGYKPTSEEVEQIKEFNKDTLKSYLNKSTEVRKLAKSNLKDIEKRPEMYKDNTDKTQQNIAAQAKKLKATIAKRTMGANRAFNRLHGVAEAADKKEMSKSARMIKSLYKKHNMTEDMTDWEKEDKSVQTYGKKPKIQTTPKKDSFGEDKPKAAIIMSGGKTMTGQTRDTVEIDPMLKQRNGPDDFDRNYGKKQPQ